MDCESAKRIIARLRALLSRLPIASRLHCAYKGSTMPKRSKQKGFDAALKEACNAIMEQADYGALLLEFKPRPIRNAKDKARALRQIDEIKRRCKGERLSGDEAEFVELLWALIERYLASVPPAKVSPGERLAELIQARGISQADLSRATEIPPGTITNIIVGRRGMSTANVARLAKYFGVSPAEFIASPCD